jgi:nucleotide-binding universal stress UspA family protein
MKILTTTDGSKESRAVIPVVRQLASGGKASVMLLSVVQRPAATARAPAGPAEVIPGAQLGSTGALQMNPEAILEPGAARWAESPDQAVTRVEAEAQDALRDLASELKRDGIEVATAVVMSKDVPEAIIDEAKEGGYDLIAMATHGRSGLRAIVQGSVAAAVLKSGVAPVVLVRPKE